MDMTSPIKKGFLLYIIYCVLALLSSAEGWAAKSSMNDTLKIGVEHLDGGSVEGIVTNDEGAPLGGVIVRALLLPDSIVKGGAATDTLGRYEISPLPYGNYCLKSEAMGYEKKELRFVVTEDKPIVTANPVRMIMTDMKLGEAIVVGSAPLVTVTDDTVAYNASAMSTPEGAMAEELIEQIPGAEITEDGKIKINGKEYNKVLIDGKEFFGNDPSATLNNLPANIIRRIKTYDRKSDRARLTGIDDGEEHNVIDIEIKRNMFKGLVGNVGLSAGNKDRYAERVTVNRFRSNQHAALVANMNNVNNPAFSERGNGASNSSRQARSGYTASKSVGVTYAKEERKKYKVSGNIRYGYTNAENKSERRTETKYSNLSEYYNNGNSYSDRRRRELNAELEWEWHPDTLTTIQMRPSLSYNQTDNISSSRGMSRSWSGNEEDTIEIVNRTNSLNHTDTNGLTTSSSFLLFRRLSQSGRNVSFNASLSYNDNNSVSAVRNFATYYKSPLKNRNYDRYNDGGTYKFRYSFGVNYTEPLFKNTYLQLRYNFSSSRSRTKRFGYEYTHENGDTVFAITDIDWAAQPIDTTLSNITENRYVAQTFNLNFRHVTSKLNLNYGVQFNPRHSESDFILGQRMDRGLVTQNLMNWSPSLRFKYRFTRRNTLDLSYTGSSSEPDVEQLQELIDKTNPQYIRYGNPDLKPAFSHNVRARFNMYGENSHRSLVTNWGYTNTSNTTSTMSFSESSTGFRISKLMNVSGQWSTNGNINFNMPLDSLQRWNLSTTTSGSFSENTNFNSTPLSVEEIKSIYADKGYSSLQEVAYEDIDLLRSEARENHTHGLHLNQGISLRYRNSKFSARVGGKVAYYKVENSVKNGLQRETYDYTATANLQAELPLNSQISTTVNYVSRHGYSSSIQKNICVWNAQLVKRLFARNAGMISLQIFDILHQRNDVTRTINNISISDTRRLMLQDYFLLSFQYNFNTMRNRGRMKGAQGKHRQKPGAPSGREGGYRSGGSSVRTRR